MSKRIVHIGAITLLSLMTLILLGYLCRRPLMHMAGNYLIVEDAPEKCDAMFVLSGGAVDRSAQAAKFFRMQMAPFIVCTGENIPSLFEILDLNITESELSRKALVRNGVPDSLIKEMHRGTSTREEADLVLQYCQQQQLKKIMVISDKFHTRRINNTFRKKLKVSGIEMVLCGAPSSRYREDLWWAGEAGLLMVNNEYIKLMYYFVSGLNDQ